MIDALADEFVELDENGFYVNKQEYRERLESNASMVVQSPVKSPTKKMNFGRWSDEEHALFLEALLVHGKDWDLIESHIGTRDVKNIRSHAQKFFNKLVKAVDNNITSEIPLHGEKYIAILRDKVARFKQN